LCEVISVLSQTSMESLRTQDRRNINRLLSLLNSPSKGRRLASFVASVAMAVPFDEASDYFTRSVNRKLKELRFFPQLRCSCDRRTVKWLSAADSRIERQYDMAVHAILSLHERGLLERLRKCRNPPCPVWFYAWNLKNKFHGSVRCKNRVEYLTLTEAQLEKRKREARLRMREQRRNAKERERRELELSRKREARGR
jgi:hypothetical protein